MENLLKDALKLFFLISLRYHVALLNCALKKGLVLR